jgi:hypothetical protein
LDRAFREVDYVKTLGAKRIDIPSLVLESALSENVQCWIECTGCRPKSAYYRQIKGGAMTACQELREVRRG